VRQALGSTEPRVHAGLRSQTDHAATEAIFARASDMAGRCDSPVPEEEGTISSIGPRRV